VPDWFADTYRDAIDDLAAARHAIERHERRDADIEQRLRDVDEQLRQLAPSCAPHDRAIADARTELDSARDRQRHAERDLTDSGILGRRAARRELTDATEEVDTAQAVLDQRTSRAQPVLSPRSELEREHRELRDHLRHGSWMLRSIDRLDERIDTAHHTITALDTWNRWATGHHVTAEDLSTALGILQASDRSDHASLAAPLQRWGHEHGLRPAAAVERPGMEIAGPDLW
jgi:chromosome segregation ATPase